LGDSASVSEVNREAVSGYYLEGHSWDANTRLRTEGSGPRRVANLGSPGTKIHASGQQTGG